MLRAWLTERDQTIRLCLPTSDRLAFGALSRLLTAVRGLGYYEEYLAGERRSDREDLARLEDSEA